MSGLDELLRTLIGLLDDASIPYMVVGSFASTVHGEPRTTRDLDVVIDPSAASLERLLAGLDPERFYVDADTAREALARRTMFNVIDLTSAWKIDLVVRKARPFSIAELGRRAPASIAGVVVVTATAEDTIIAKLEWAKAGGSERQLDDVAGVIRMVGAALDRAYIERWVEDLDLRELWARASALAT